MRTTMEQKLIELVPRATGTCVLVVHVEGDRNPFVLSEDDGLAIDNSVVVWRDGAIDSSSIASVYLDDPGAA